MGLSSGTPSRWALKSRGKFLESLDNLGVLAGMARTRADMGEAELLQQRPDITFAIIDPEAVLDDALKIDAPPAHDAVDFPVRSGLDDRGEFGLVCRREAPIRAAASDRAIRPARPR